MHLEIDHPAFREVHTRTITAARSDAQTHLVELALVAMRDEGRLPDVNADEGVEEYNLRCHQLAAELAAEYGSVDGKAAFTEAELDKIRDRNRGLDEASNPNVTIEEV